MRRDPSLNSGCDIEAIADTVDCLNHGFAGDGFEFLSQIFDVRVDTAIHAEGGAMQVVEQLLAGERLTGAAGENLQQFEFIRGEFERTAV